MLATVTSSIISSLINYLYDNWPEVILVVGLAAQSWYLSKLNNKLVKDRWQKKEFINKMNFSLNLIHEGKLKIRTLIEIDSNDVFLDKSSTDVFLKYAMTTKPEQPFIKIDNSDLWFIYNPILNKISELFAISFFDFDNGKLTNEVPYLFCLTREMEEKIRTYKIRVIIIKKDLLQNLPDPAPVCDSNILRTRWDLILNMKKLYDESPNHFKQFYVPI